MKGSENDKIRQELYENAVAAVQLYMKWLHVRELEYKIICFDKYCRKKKKPKPRINPNDTNPFLVFLVRKLKESYYKRKGYTIVDETFEKEPFEWSYSHYKELSKQIFNGATSGWKTLQRMFNGKYKITKNQEKLSNVDAYARHVGYKHWLDLVYQHTQKAEDLEQLEFCLEYYTRKEFNEYKALPPVDKHFDYYSSENFEVTEVRDEFFDYMLHEHCLRSAYPLISKLDTFQDWTIHTENNPSDCDILKWDIESYEEGYVVFHVQILYTLIMHSCLTKKFSKHVELYVKHRIFARRSDWDGWWDLYEESDEPMEYEYRTGVNKNTFKTDNICKIKKRYDPNFKTPWQS